MPLISLSNGTNFSAEPAESLLEAAIRSGATLAYSCRSGRCSACKCKVLQGNTALLGSETGLTEQEKADGFILSCVRSANDDVVLEAEDLAGIQPPPIKTIPCRIQSLNLLAADVMQVMLRIPPSAEFGFLPGQYIDVIGNAGLRRSYSLANASAKDKLLELHIRAVPGGAMSQYWFEQAKVNDLLRLNGPLGTFFLRHAGGRDLVFLATGTGFAPVKAILEGISSLPDAERPRSITAYWGGRTSADLYCPVEQVSTACRFVPVLSRADASWTGARGYVQDVCLNDQFDMSRTIVYACGSENMIHSAKTLLVGAGLPERFFYSDAFVCSSST